jgi:23S rRNA (uridine2552-2'-O)-methyltransferase
VTGSGPSGREGGRSLKQRVKTAKKRTSSSTRWLERQLNDPYVAEARRRGFRSRAAFKLLQLDERFHLLAPGRRIVDLGAAPGGWTQVAAAAVSPPGKPAGRVIAVDLLPMDPVAGVRFVQGDFGDDAVLKAVEAELGGRKADLVLSDLAPNISGIEAADQARSVYLGELALDFATRSLQLGGDLIVKAFQGEGFTEFQRLMQRHFDKVYVRKPKASRDRSREVFLVGKRRIALLPNDDNPEQLAQEGPRD